MSRPIEGISRTSRPSLREAFGAFATGVTVVTCRDTAGQPIGFTANSFTSVSLEPPLLLVCLAKTSTNLESFSQASSFAVNVLAADQASLSTRFAARVPDRFAGTEWSPGLEGAPLLAGVAAWFDCMQHQVVDAGDHLVLMGRIIDFGRNERQPLIYLRGQYLDRLVSSADQDGQVPGVRFRAGGLLGRGDQVILQRDGAGWKLPDGVSKRGFQEARGHLEQVITEAGIRSQWRFLYSIFDAPEEAATWVFFFGTIDADTPLPNDMRLFSINELPLDAIAQQPVRGLLKRYAHECRTAQFGLYVGHSGHNGHVARFTGAPMNWELAIKD